MPINPDDAIHHLTEGGFSEEEARAIVVLLNAWISSSEEESGTSPDFIDVEEKDGAYYITYSKYEEKTFRSPPRGGTKKNISAIPEGLIERLDEFYHHLDRAENREVTKGLIAEIAIDIFLRDWEMNGDESFSLEAVKSRTRKKRT